MGTKSCQLLPDSKIPARVPGFVAWCCGLNMNWPCRQVLSTVLSFVLEAAKEWRLSVAHMMLKLLLGSIYYDFFRICLGTIFFNLLLDEH